MTPAKETAREKSSHVTWNVKGLGASKGLGTSEDLARIVQGWPCEGLAGANRSHRYADARRASSHCSAIRSRHVRRADWMVVGQCGDFESRSADRILLLHDRLARHRQLDPALSRFWPDGSTARRLSLMGDYTVGAIAAGPSRAVDRRPLRCAPRAALPCREAAVEVAQTSGLNTAIKRSTGAAPQGRTGGTSHTSRQWPARLCILASCKKLLRRQRCPTG